MNPKPTKRPYDVFLSHNSADKPSVEFLAERLVDEEDLNPFLDKWHLVPGEPWQEALEEALDQSKTVAVFLGPSGISPWHNVEMRSALDTSARDKTYRVIPVLLPGARMPEEGEMPRFLALLTWVDFRGGLNDDEPFHRLVSGIEGLPPGRRAEGVQLPRTRHDFYKHINMPDNYVPRPELLTEVKEALLGSKEGLALTSSLSVKASPGIALHGMGGIGKSAAARALCDDPEVQAAYPDGILWARLGQQPEISTRLKEWVDELGGRLTATAPTASQYKESLVELLEDKACLLIVDDAWEAEHLRFFKVAGPNCRTLVTTRDASLADEIQAEVHAIPPMSMDEAVALLEQWAGRALDEIDREIKEEISKKLVRLPLALRLAGSQLSETPPEEWLEEFQELRDLDATWEADDPELSLNAGFQLSLRRLKQSVRRLYISLGIFKEDEPVPEVAITKLWGSLELKIRVRDAPRLLDELAGKALLALQDGETREVVLHDLLRKMLQEELGDETKAIHRELLNAYEGTKPGDGWHTAPDDGYLYDHLLYHIAAVEDDPAIENLFEDDAWMHARWEGSDYVYDGFINDLMLAWGRAHETAIYQVKTDISPQKMLHCIRYALIRTSLNSLAASYDPSLVARAVETSLWSPKRALRIASNIPVQRHRFQMVLAILKTGVLTKEEKLEASTLALATALAIELEPSRARALTALAPNLSGDAQVTALQGGLEAVQAIQYERERAEALAALVPQLSGDLLQQGLATAQAIQDERDRARALAALAPQLNIGLLQQGLAAAQAIQYERDRAEALAALAPQLSGDLLQQGLATAQAIQYERDRGRALAALAPQLNGDLLRQGLAAALAIKGEVSRARALAALAPQLNGGLLQQGLAAAQAIQDEGSQVRTLAALAPQLSGETKATALEQALAATQTIQEEWDRVEALAALAPQLSGDLLQQGLAAAQAIQDEYHRARALAALAPQLSGKTKVITLEGGLAAAQAIQDEGYRAETLAALAPQLSGDLLRRGLAAVQAIQDGWFQARALAALVPRLSEDLLQQGLAATQAIHDEGSQAKALVALAPQLSGDAQATALQGGLAAAQTIQDERDQARALAALAPQLSGETKATALRDGLAATQAIQDEWDLAGALAYLAPQLSGDLLQQGLAAAQAIQDEWDRVQALAALAPQLSGDAQATTLQGGLAAAQAIRDEWSRAEALAALAPQLKGDLLQLGLAAAQAIQDEGSRARALAALAPQLNGDLLQLGLAAAQAVKDESSQARALAALAPQLSGDLLQQGLATAQAIQDEGYRVRALAALAPQLSGDLLQQGLETAQAIQYEGSRAHALAALVPRLSGETKATALQGGLAAAQTIQDEWDRAQALAALAPYLSGDLLQQALGAVPAIQEKNYQAEALAALAPKILDDPLLIKQLRENLLNLLLDHQSKTRSELLSTIAMKGLFTKETTGLSDESFAEIVDHILEVCNNWEWL